MNTCLVIFIIVPMHTKKAALIVFYIATRMVSLPIIGLQTDIGTIDTVSKVLQGAIIVGSLFVLRLPKRILTIDKMKQN